MLQEAGHIKNANVAIFWHIQCLHLMYLEVTCVTVSSGTQVQPQIILDLEYPPDYLSISHDYGYVSWFRMQDGIVRKKPKRNFRLEKYYLQSFSKWSIDSQILKSVKCLFLVKDLEENTSNTNIAFISATRRFNDGLI